MKSLLKHVFLVLMVCCIIIVPYVALAEEGANDGTPCYTAITKKEFHLREEPESNRRVAKVKRGAAIDVLEFGEDWCLCSYKGDVGYAMTRWLMGYVSLDPYEYTKPFFDKCVGFVIAKNPMRITGGNFPGLVINAGDRIAVYGDSLECPVWRGTTVLNKYLCEYVPFIEYSAAEPGDIIAGFTTYYNNRTGYPLHRERQHNIELACKLLNHAVVMPDERFSFNGVCGPYRMKTGYQVAPNISKEGTGVGGGVCQVTTTLFNALLEIPIQITDWSVHQESGVRYAKIDFDAAVGNSGDFCFVNTLPYPIEITVDAQNGALTVLIQRASADTANS